MILLKFLHLFALMLGSAASIGNLILAYRMAHVPADAPKFAPIAPIFGLIGLVGILLIWLTGMWILAAKWDVADLGLFFWVKMAGATLLLAGSILFNVLGMMAAARGKPPPMLVRRLGPYMFPVLLVTVGAAVWVFG